MDAVQERYVTLCKLAFLAVFDNLFDREGRGGGIGVEGFILMYTHTHTHTHTHFRLWQISTVKNLLDHFDSKFGMSGDTTSLCVLVLFPDQ